VAYDQRSLAARGIRLLLRQQLETSLWHGRILVAESQQPARN
jgi:hypothetical protein